MPAKITLHQNSQADIQVISSQLKSKLTTILTKYHDQAVSLPMTIVMRMYNFALVELALHTKLAPEAYPTIMALVQEITTQMEAQIAEFEAKKP